MHGRRKGGELGGPCPPQNSLVPTILVTKKLSRKLKTKHLHEHICPKLKFRPPRKYIYIR